MIDYYSFLLLLRGIKKNDVSIKKMGKAHRIKDIWKVINQEWKIHYRLVFSNEETLEQRFTIKNITIQKAFIIVVISTFIIIILTTILIALTPLRVYVPGYTTQKDYKAYKSTVAHIDSLEKIIDYNQQYIDNILTMLRDEAPGIETSEEDGDATPHVHMGIRDKKRMAETEELIEESEMILGRIQNEGSTSTPSIDQAKISSISIYPPSVGIVTNVFNATKNHYGIDISGEKNNPVNSIADGMVIFSGYHATDGYVIIIQHPGNLISIYKRNAALLKRTGARVSAGEPIAVMGNTGSTEGKSIHLHFELWYNGFPINPLDYLVIQ